MSFVKLHSCEGNEFLRDFFDSPKIKRVAAGRLSVDDAENMVADEAMAALSLIRWPDSNGVPVCTKCGELGAYLLGTGRWKCRKCYHQFTATSGTVLGGRKMPLKNYLVALALITDQKEWGIISRVRDRIGCDYRTAHLLFHKLRANAAPKASCSVPFGLITRAVWELSRNAVRSNIAQWTRPRLQSYPFMSAVPKREDRGTELVLFVNEIVPKSWPEEIRADVCQDMIVAILQGEHSQEEVRADVKKFISRVLQESPWKYKWISFDAPRGDEDGRTLHELIGNDISGDIEEWLDEKREHESAYQ